MTRKDLIAVADELTEQIEEANLRGEFSPILGEAVNKFEWMVHFEGMPEVPRIPPTHGGQAHARLMDSLSFVLANGNDN